MDKNIYLYSKNTKQGVFMEKKILDFIKANNDVAFATVTDDGKPQIRVFRIMLVKGDTLYFATARHKAVWKQLQENNNIELLAMKGDISVRIAGKAEFDVEEEICKQIFNENDVLQRLYSDYKSMAYFSMKISKIDYYDLTPTPPVLESYTF